MDELRAPELDEPVWVYRVGADFSVAARDMPEARTLVERALAGETRDGVPFLTRDLVEVEEGMRWGVLDSEAVPARPSQAALVQEKYPGLVGELAMLEGLGVLLRTANAVPAQTRERIQAALTGMDRHVFAEDPGRAGGPRIFEGTASAAAAELTEGVYRAFDYEDREYALVVAPSELAPSGRVSAAFPKEHHDARALDEISRLLEQHTRRQPLTELVRSISGRVETTRRAGFPSWVPLEGEPERPRPPARLQVGVIVWSDLPGDEPTVVASASPLRVAHTLATTLHALLRDSDAFAGATEFLRTHVDPADWNTPEDVDAWLEALREAAPFPTFSIHAVTLPAASPAPLRDALDQRARGLNPPAEQQTSRTVAPGTGLDR